MSGTPLRFGLAGCGSIAATHAEAVAGLPPDQAVLAACCDVVPERARDFGGRYGLRVFDWPALLADPEIDAVTVCTPSGLHAQMGAEALKAGKHVVVEKPMDVTRAACDRLLQARQAHGKTLAVISQHRFDPATRQIKDVLESGALGALFLAEARVPWFRTQDYYDAAAWRGTWALDGGGCLMNQGIHTADLMRWLCGPVERVYAQARRAAHPQIEAEDVVVAALTFAGGALGTLTASTAAFPGFPARLALYGTRGTAILEGDSLHTLAIQGQEEAGGGEAALAHALQVAAGGTRAATQSLEMSGPNEAGPDVLRWGDSHRAQLADFVRCCRTGETPLVDGEQGRNAVDLVLAVYESARTGQVVRMPGADE